MGPQSAGITCSDSVHKVVLLTLKYTAREGSRCCRTFLQRYIYQLFKTQMYKRQSLQNIIPDEAMRALGIELCNKENRY
jgi:hypothetical protein